MVGNGKEKPPASLLPSDLLLPTSLSKTLSHPNEKMVKTKKKLIKFEGWQKQAGPMELMPSEEGEKREEAIKKQLVTLAHSAHGK